jgi:hypothetical protein
VQEDTRRVSVYARTLEPIPVVGDVLDQRSATTRCMRQFTWCQHLLLRTPTPRQRALRPETRPPILDLVEERRLGLVGMVIWSVVLLPAACGIGFGVWLSLQRWMLIPPGVVLSECAASSCSAAPPTVAAHLCRVS